MRGLLAFGLLAVVAVGVSPAVGGKDGKDDEAKLQGKWVGDLKGLTITVTFTKDKYTMEFGDKATFKGMYQVDPAKKPKAMDLVIKEGPMFEGKTARAIYALDGDTLKWCSHEPGKEERPRDFPAKDGDEGAHLYVTFKRAK